MSRWTVHPATPGRWKDVEKLFGARGACAGCWCMFLKGSRKEWEANRGDGNRAKLRAEVAAGRKPGLLAYDGREPIGWCAVEPRSRYAALERSRVLKPLDDEPVWSATCFFVRADRRNQGVTEALLEAAKEHVVRNGGRVLEGYPVDTRRSASRAPAFLWHGIASTFESAGFRECARRSPTRPIYRWRAQRS